MSESKKEKFLQLVHGNNKERDLEILTLHVTQPELTLEEIKKTLGLNITINRISMILSENEILRIRLFMSLNPLSTREGRLFELARLFNKKKKLGTRRDLLDILDLMRKECVDEKNPIVNINFSEGERDERIKRLREMLSDQR